jgi:hypothetical protein
MSAESDFWAAFTYDSGSDRWDLAPHMDPMGVLVICLAKIRADREAVADAVASSEVAFRDAVWAVLNSPDTSAEEMVMALRGYMLLTEPARGKA